MQEFSVPVFLLLPLKSIKHIVSQLELETLSKDLLVGSVLYLRLAATLDLAFFLLVTSPEPSYDN